MPTLTTTTTATVTPAAASAVASLSEHPSYTAFRATWELLAHAAEGTGPFADGTAIVPHPREYLDHSTVEAYTTTDGQPRTRIVANPNPRLPSRKLIERQKLARYEDWPDTIVTLLAGGLFRHAPTRNLVVADSADKHPFLAWADDVDGRGTNLDDWWAFAWRRAAVFGHVFVVIDRPLSGAPTAADAPPFYLRLYTPLDVTDWLTDDLGHLMAIQAIEVVPRTAFTREEPSLQVREITANGWTVRALDRKRGVGDVMAAGRVDFQGALPVLVLKARERSLSTILGKSVLGDPHLYIDDYNMSSEIRELERKQTFSIINIPLGVNPNGGPAVGVEEAQAMIGTVMGTGNFLFTPLEAQVLTGESSNIEVYQAEQDRLRRTMFRLAGLPWESDSRAAESAESRRLKREDLNQTLSVYADALENVDNALAELWFRGTYGASWAKAWAAAEASINWPDTFDSEVLDDLIARAEMAIALVPSKTFVATVRKDVAAKALPNLAASQKAEIDTEIDALLTPEEQRQQQFEQRMSQLSSFDPEAAPNGQ